MTTFRKALVVFVATAALSMSPNREAEAVGVVVGCFSGPNAVTTLNPTVWCSAVWSPGLPYSLFLIVGAQAVRLVDGATATGSRAANTFLPLGSVGPIIVTCSSLASAATMSATASRWVFSPTLFGLTPVGPLVRNSVLGAVGVSPNFQSCLPIL